VLCEQLGPIMGNQPISIAAVKYETQEAKAFFIFNMQICKICRLCFE
jgi:hypothetical protein